MPPSDGGGGAATRRLTRRSPASTSLRLPSTCAIYFLSVAFLCVLGQNAVACKKSLLAVNLIEGIAVGWYNLIPLAVLVTLLVKGFTPTYAAGISILFVVGSHGSLKISKMGPKAIIEALSQGANMIITALAGIGLTSTWSVHGYWNNFSLDDQQLGRTATCWWG